MESSDSTRNSQLWSLMFPNFSQAPDFNMLLTSVLTFSLDFFHSSVFPRPSIPYRLIFPHAFFICSQSHNLSHPDFFQ